MNLPAARAGIVELLPDIKPAIVGVGSFHPFATPRGRLLGTGFVVADGRHLITNAHVIPALLETDKGEHLAAFTRDGMDVGTRKLEAVASDSEHDLVLLKFDGPALPALRLTQTKAVREGETYYFTGYPVGAALGLHPATHRAGLAAIAPVYSPPRHGQGAHPQTDPPRRVPIPHVPARRRRPPRQQRQPPV
ncbi:MAG: serine protease [Pseudomonadota bacterium]